MLWPKLQQVHRTHMTNVKGQEAKPAGLTSKALHLHPTISSSAPQPAELLSSPRR